MTVSPTQINKEHWFRKWYQNSAIDLHQGSFYDVSLILLLIVAEFGLGYLIIRKVPYTEIDWVAYMQEVEAVVDHGILDYHKIRGDTGPIVYPAGFVYLFAVLRYLTRQGRNIALAQFLFLGFYVATQATVFLIYFMALQTERRRFQTKVLLEVPTPSASQHQQEKQQRLYLAHRIWGWRVLMGVLCLSKRVHSIFLLRLFNDGPTMLLLYMSMLLFMKQYWQWGCFVFSLAVSLKMNILLFAPGLLLLLLQSTTSRRDWFITVVWKRLFLGCALPQLILGAPFLATHPISYLRKAFELDRVFFYKWTVNWKFLPPDMFVSKPWALLLLACHLSCLIFLTYQWLTRTAAETGRSGLFPLHRKESTKHELGEKHNSATPSSAPWTKLSPGYIAYTMMASNFVGIAFARTLHYQFYCWYFHALPFLMWYSIPSSFDTTTKSSAAFLILTLVVMAAVEFAFLTFPATATSSAVLLLAHWIVLWQVLRRPPPSPILLMDDSNHATMHTGKVEPKKTR